MQKRQLTYNQHINNLKVFRKTREIFKFNIKNILKYRFTGNVKIPYLKFLKNVFQKPKSQSFFSMIEQIRCDIIHSLTIFYKLTTITNLNFCD